MAHQCHNMQATVRNHDDGTLFRLSSLFGLSKELGLSRERLSCDLLRPELTLAGIPVIESSRSSSPKPLTAGPS